MCSPTATTHSRDQLTPSQQALKHRWLTGATAGDHDIVKDLRSRRVKARLRLGIERVQLAKRIEQLKNQLGQDEAEDVPADAGRAADEAFATKSQTPVVTSTREKLSRAAKAEIFREVVLAAAREEKRAKELERAEKGASKAKAVTSTIPSRPKGT